MHTPTNEAANAIPAAKPASYRDANKDSRQALALQVKLLREKIRKVHH